MIKVPNILIILAGHAIDIVKAQYGDFDAQFSHITGLKHPTYSFADEWPQKAIPAAKDFDGVIISGSAAMLNDDEAWMTAATQWVKQTIHDEVPLLGVCFGHQLLGKAASGEVGPNPTGRSNGTRTVYLNDVNDLIFSQIPRSFQVQVSHRDVILTKSDKITVLGKSDHDEHHVIRCGSCAWGVQFHPEWDMSTSEIYAKARASANLEATLQTLSPSPDAGHILKHFVDFCRKRKN